MTAQKSFNHRVGFIIKIEAQEKDVKPKIKRLKSHQNEMFALLDWENVSPYNNQAEE